MLSEDDDSFDVMPPPLSGFCSDAADEDTNRRGVLPRQWERLGGQEKAQPLPTTLPPTMKRRSLGLIGVISDYYFILFMGVLVSRLFSDMNFFVCSVPLSHLSFIFLLVSITKLE